MNTCFTCNFYGKCDVRVKTCPDWTAWDKSTIVLNLDAFNGLWLGLHKKWFERYPRSLLNKRRKVIKLYLSGETESQIINRLSTEITNNLLEVLDAQKEE